jgi:hypothetical protein
MNSDVIRIDQWYQWVVVIGTVQIRFDLIQLDNLHSIYRDTNQSRTASFIFDRIYSLDLILTSSPLLILHPTY